MRNDQWAIDLGFELQTKPATASVVAANGATENRVGEILRGTGAFVKTVTLRHVAKR